MTRRHKSVCGAMGTSDVCGEALYHEGPHVGRWEGGEWSREPGRPSDRKAASAKSRAASQADEDRRIAERNRGAGPHVRTPKVKPLRIGRLRAREQHPPDREPGLPKPHDPHGGRRHQP